MPLASSEGFQQPGVFSETQLPEYGFSEDGLQKRYSVKKTASAPHISQMATTTTAAPRLTGFSSCATSRAFSLHSSKMSRGIILGDQNADGDHHHLIQQ